jgi:hypothetical protein
MARLIAIECHGARAAIRMSTQDLMGAVVTHSLPLGWAPTAPRAGDREFELAIDGGGAYAVSVDGALKSRHDELEFAVGALRSHVFMHVLSTPRERVFVHAGCVAHAGRAILLPGTSGAGKTTLVAALVRAGAVYYTDDYAPLDRDGRVHPYPLPLWMRDQQTGVGRPHRVEELGGTAGHEPVDVAVVAEIGFCEGRWQVRRCGASESVLLLLAHALNPQHEPGFALSAVRGAVLGAVVLEGERGDADEAAATLLELAEGRAPVPRG